jgi:hypothetical protein
MIVTLGFTVNKHYSGGELFSLALFGEPESCCEDMCSCCDEESETVQFLVDYAFSIDNLESTPVEVELITISLLLGFVETDLVENSNEFFDQDLPPPDNLTRLSFFQTYIL